MPCTAAATACTVVRHGNASGDRRGADLVAVDTRPGVARGTPRSVEDQVHAARQDLLDDVARAVGELADDLGLDPVASQDRAVPAVARIRKPRSDRRFTGKIAARLSRLATDTNTVPFTGSDP